MPPPKIETCPQCGRPAPGGLFSHGGEESEDRARENVCDVEGCPFGGIRHCGCIWGAPAHA